MRIVDDLILDSATFVPNGAALDLSGLGFQVLDADFGEADVELQSARQALGEIPTDYHPPNTVTSLKLAIRPEGEVDLPTAAHKLAQKVGEINTPGTEHWLERVFKYEGAGKFAGPLGRKVFKATLSGLGAWQRGDSPDVVLTLVTGPYWYAATEQESTVFTETAARELVWELASVFGTNPGLIRVRVQNDGEADWRGLILAGESRDMAQDATADTTAAPAYDAVKLTLKGGSVEKERESTKVVRHESLTAGWLAILNSEIAGVGHMTHKGVRRLWARIYDPGSEAGDVQLRLRWRALGSLRWSEDNDIVPTPLVDGWALIDLGECRPEPASAGDERWEWELQARAVSGAGVIDVHRVWPLPTEQYAVVKAPGVSQGADAQSQKSPGTVANAAGVGSVAWAEAEKAKASDNTHATAALESNQSNWLKATNLGFAIPEAATIVDILAECEIKISAGESTLELDAQLVKAGAGAGNIVENFDVFTTTDKYKTVIKDLAATGIIPTPTEANAANFGVQVSIATATTPITVSVDHIRLTIYYTEAADENRVCFATRSIDLASDDIRRQHPEDDVWGRVVPEGFLPYASPSGMEGRATRFIIIPTQGDLGELPDSGSNKLSAQAFVRAAYLVSREAA